MILLKVLLIFSLAVHSLQSESAEGSGVQPEFDPEFDPQVAHTYERDPRPTLKEGFEDFEIEGSGDTDGQFDDNNLDNDSVDSEVEASGDVADVKYDTGDLDEQVDDMGIGANTRRKRQTEDVQNPLTQNLLTPVEPVAVAQAQRGHNGRSDESDERNGRHRPNRPDRPDRPDRPSCNTVRCTADTECIIENGRPTCRPIRQPSRSCRDINCPRDTRCRMERDPRCRDRNCPEQPICIRDSNTSCRNVQCPSGWRCRVQEEPGCRGRGCREIATCVNPCDGVRCPFGSMCRFDGFQPSCTPVVINQCLNARCPQGFQCRMVDNQPRCFPVTSPQCRQNEVFAQCASPCEPSCSHATPQICPLRCDPPRCQCAPGFWRHATGSCVQRDQCFFG